MQYKQTDREREREVNWPFRGESITTTTTTDTNTANLTVNSRFGKKDDILSVFHSEILSFLFPKRSSGKRLLRRRRRRRNCAKGGHCNGPLPSTGEVEEVEEVEVEEVEEVPPKYSASSRQASTLFFFLFPIPLSFSSPIDYIFVAAVVAAAAAVREMSCR